MAEKKKKKNYNILGKIKKTSNSISALIFPICQVFCLRASTWWHVLPTHAHSVSSPLLHPLVPWVAFDHLFDLAKYCLQSTSVSSNLLLCLSWIFQRILPISVSGPVHFLKHLQSCKMFLPVILCYNRHRYPQPVRLDSCWSLPPRRVFQISLSCWLLRFCPVALYCRYILPNILPVPIIHIPPIWLNDCTYTVRHGLWQSN